MGLNHARALTRLSEATLVGVTDIHSERAAGVASELGCAAMTPESLLGHVDAVVVATPAHTHAAVALPLIKAGIHCLIEKPIALTLSDCESLGAAGPGIVRIGYIERFNPAFRAFVGLARQSVTAITAYRLNAPSRPVALDVIDDLMVHDLDLALILKGLSADCVAARRIGREQREAEIRFSDGSTATFAVNRACQASARSMVIVADGTAHHLNFVERCLTPAPTMPTQNQDQLEAEIVDFMMAIAGQRGVGATVTEATAVQRLALAITGKLAQ